MDLPLATNTQPGGNPMRSIAEVERDTGLPRATLRIWERRYGFPTPGRDERGDRCYPTEQVELLKQMRGLQEQGWRPAALLAAGPEEIRKLSAVQALLQPQVVGRSRGEARLIRLLREHDVQGFKAELDAILLKSGLLRFAGKDVASLNRLIGHAWFTGELQVHEEHLYSDCVYQVLRGAISGLQDDLRPEAPVVVLTTFPQESHGLGLSMAQAVFALQGCPTVSLGVRLPIEQIASAARAYAADLIGLSFTASMAPAHVLRGLEELRGLVPPAVRIWAGGDCPVLRRRTVPGVRIVTDVLHIGDFLAEDFALPPRELPSS